MLKASSQNVFLVHNNNCQVLFSSSYIYRKHARDNRRVIQSASLISDAAIVQHVNIATLEKMRENYTKLSEFLDKEENDDNDYNDDKQKKGE